VLFGDGKGCERCKVQTCMRAAKFECLAGAPCMMMMSSSFASLLSIWLVNQKVNCRTAGPSIPTQHQLQEAASSPGRDSDTA
jgi:hypothetical protein